MVRKPTRFDWERDVLFFLRVPKTASTSVATALSQVVGSDRTVHLPDRHIDGLDFGVRRTLDQCRRFGKRAASDLWGGVRQILGCSDPLAAAQFLHGHHPLWINIRTRRRQRHIIVFREPSERFLSLYYYYLSKAKRVEKTRSVEKTAILEMDPNEYLHWALRKGLDVRLNSHCLYLSRSGQFEDARQALDRNVLFASTVETLPRLFASLSNFLGVQMPEAQLLKVGTEKGTRKPLDARSRKLLREVLEPDYRLYDYVSENVGKLTS